MLLIATCRNNTEQFESMGDFILNRVAQVNTELADREVIRECLFRNARAIDRCEEELFWSVYWPGAIHTGAGFSLPIEQFVPFFAISIRAYDQVMHMIGNILIKLNGAVAVTETYFSGYHRYTENGLKRDNIQAGRYLDSFEQRDGDWRIVERTVIVDWFRDYADSADWGKGTLGIQPIMGGRYPEDKSYALFKGIETNVTRP